MTTPAPDEPPQVLDYGRPARPVSARRVFAAIFGIAAAFGGCLSLFCMVVIAGSLIGNPNAPAVDRREDIAELVGFAVIGLVLGAISWRWCRFAFREARDS